MTKVLGLAIVLLLGLRAEAAAAGCWVPRFRTFANQTVDAFMQTDAGKPRKVHFRSSGPRYSVVIYRSQAGYAGSDTFTYARRGFTTLGAPAVTTVRMAVTVSK